MKICLAFFLQVHLDLATALARTHLQEAAMTLIQFQDKYISHDDVLALDLELHTHHAKLLCREWGDATRPAKILACDPVVEYDENRVTRESILAIMLRYGFSERS